VCDDDLAGRLKVLDELNASVWAAQLPALLHNCRPAIHPAAIDAAAQLDSPGLRRGRLVSSL